MIMWLLTLSLLSIYYDSDNEVSAFMGVKIFDFTTMK